MRLRDLLEKLGNYYYMNGDTDVFVGSNVLIKEDFEILESANGCITLKTLQDLQTDYL